ncbi:MAG: MBL fold metallo-hydrolase [Candidatus Hydrogenedentales bacterium]|jgi:glyoxylase-like metal-dependent hydrolase (beta-lactamase superfamily II)
MIVRRFLLDVNEANAFLVVCEETKEAMLVDAGAFAPAIAEYIAAYNLKLSQVFVTHDHYDHTDGLASIVARYGAKVFAGKHSVGGCDAIRVSHGGTVRVGRIEGTVRETPGHTPEGISLVIPGHVFTGDALFAGSVGGTSSPENAKRQIDAIRKHIFALPPDTQIHTGHGPSSTVAIESGFNPFFV